MYFVKFKIGIQSESTLKGMAIRYRPMDYLYMDYKSHFCKMIAFYILFFYVIKFIIT